MLNFTNAISEISNFIDNIAEQATGAAMEVTAEHMKASNLSDPKKRKQQQVIDQVELYTLDGNIEHCIQQAQALLARDPSNFNKYQLAQREKLETIVRQTSQGIENVKIRNDELEVSKFGYTLAIYNNHCNMVTPKRLFEQSANNLSVQVNYLESRARKLQHRLNKAQQVLDNPSASQAVVNSFKSLKVKLKEATGITAHEKARDQFVENRYKIKASNK